MNHRRLTAVAAVLLAPLGLALTPGSAAAAPTTTGSWTLYPAQTTQTVYQAAVQQPINPDGSSSWPAKRGVIPVQFSLQSATKTGPVVFESLLNGSVPASYLDFAPTASTFNQITNLQASYAFTTGNCHGGALRWSVGVGGGHSVFVYYGATPNFNDCTTVNQSAVNMTATGDARVDTSQVGGTFYDTWVHAQSLVGSLTVTDVALVLDAGWGGDQIINPLTNVTVNDNTFVPLASGTTAFTSTCNLPTATISLVKNPGTDNTAIDETLAAQSSDTGGIYRQVDCKYIYNLDASTLGAGTFNVYVNIGGSPVTGFGSFGLR